MHFLVVFFIISIFGILLTAVLNYFYIYLNKQQKTDPVIAKINNIFPQLQCAKCGYPGCEPYAKAIVHDNVAINKCSPGGQSVIDQLADFLGQEKSKITADDISQLALIDEKNCIGCTKCIAACPFDAIIGASKQMHVVLNDLCTGCELCIEPCPVDCIEMINVPETLNNYHLSQPQQIIIDEK